MNHFKSVQLAIALMAVLPISTAFADEPVAPPAVTERNERSGILNINQLAMRAPNYLIISVSPNTENDHYRNIIIGGTGSIMITSFFGSGSPSTSAGARKYYLFPRRELPSFEIYSTGEAALRTASGQIIRINPDNGRINGISGTQFSEDPNVSASNNGGVEITRSNGIMLDCGWKVGGDPCARLTSMSTFRDASGQSCRVSNRELFVLEPRMAMIYATDAELSEFLRVRCPHLDLSSLLPPPPVALPVTPVVQPEPETPAAGAALPSEPVEQTEAPTQP